MIVDRSVLARIAAIWQPDSFSSRFANLIGAWCVAYHQRYGKAPGPAIEATFESWASKSEDKDTIEAVEKLLSSLSGEYARLRKESNSDFVCDIAERHFNEVRLRRLKDQIEGDIDSGKLNDADKRVRAFERIEVGTSRAIDPLSDEEAMREAFEHQSESLVSYPGSAGEFLKPVFERDAFVAFMAPEKRGKSFWLLDLAVRAVSQRRRVAFFEVGDMSQHQILRRLASRITRRPVKAKEVQYPKTIHPADVDSGIPEVEFTAREFQKGLSWQQTMKELTKFRKQKVRSKATYFRLECHPNTSISIHGVEARVQEWAREGWVPDFVIIDYADILAPPAGVAESRDQINLTWKRMRNLSQAMHCCVVTATQSDAASYGAQTLSRSHFSEDKRKLAHVTAMLGINASEAEKEQGLYRLNLIALRGEEYSEGRCVYCASCLSIGNPCVKSCF